MLHVQMLWKLSVSAVFHFMWIVSHARVLQLVFTSYVICTCVIGAEPQRMAEVIGHARRVVQERRLVRCLFCNSLTEWQDKEGDFKPGGAAYEAFTRNTTEPLEDGRMYTVTAMFKSSL